MNEALGTVQHNHSSSVATDKSTEFLTVMISDQRFGIPILQIQDVLGPQVVTKIPLSPDEIAGSLNLRGRIVTAVDVRKRLGIQDKDDCEREMSVVVEHDSELYSLIIDRVGDVLRLKNDQFEKTPATLEPLWKEISLGIFRLEDDLLVILDVPRLLDSIGT